MHPEIEKMIFLKVKRHKSKQPRPNEGYRFVGFSVTGAGSSVSNIDLTARTATVTIELKTRSSQQNTPQRLSVMPMILESFTK